MRAPLSVERAAEIRQRQHEAHLAAIEEERAQADAVRQWLRRWDGEVLCPWRDRHDVEIRDLVAERVAAGWVVGCVEHLAGLVAAGVVPDAPDPVDRSVRVYVVGHNYKATWTENRGEAKDQALRFTAGERIELRADIAEWVNRDSPGALIEESS